MLLGITGKIGSGKHTAGLILQKKGFFLIDADKLAHTLYSHKSKVWCQLVQQFGKEILQENQEISRSKLSKIVFADVAKLQKLNAIVHPELVQEMRNKIEKAKSQNNKKIVLIGALADELSFQDLVDQLILITAPLQKRIKWLQKDRNLSKSEILKRDFFQKETSLFDLKIENNADLKAFERQIYQNLVNS